ncbi:MAG: hypothetical protein ACI9YE_002973 [Psychroserpens sp.]
MALGKPEVSMVFDEYFISVPVYRIEQEKYYLNLKIDLGKLISKSWGDDFCKKNPDLVQSYQSHHHSSYGGCWEFNEIVGYIKLHFLGTQVRGEYWETIPKRKVRTRRKQFEYKTHKLAAEVGIRDKTNDGILQAVEEYLERCKGQVKNRHIDLREFNTLKKHLDWQSLYKTNNPFA